MSLESLEMSAVFPVKPGKIYAAWLEGKKHTAMTGAHASGKPIVGSKFTAWDGYITGTNVELERDHLIVQAWRTTEFAATDADSRLEVMFAAAPTGTKVTIRHSELPKGGKEKYTAGWQEFYFDPMAKYFVP